MTKYLILLLLFSCSLQKPQPHVLGKYELSTNKETAQKQCQGFFKKFHGKYRKVKSYGVTTKVSTLQFIKDNDCSMPCYISNFHWDCYFATNDDDQGWLEFVSSVFKDYD